MLVYGCSHAHHSQHTNTRPFTIIYASTMDGLQLVVVVLLGITAVCTVGQEDYKINVNNMDNDIRAECVQRNLLETPVVNPIWYLNGATIGENPCLNSSTLNGNVLSFTITPDCEGYLQCSSGFRCSLPQRVYGKSTLLSFLFPSLLSEKPHQIS